MNVPSPESQSQHDNAMAQACEDRRSFVAKIAAVVAGSVVGVIPLVSGVWVFLDALRRKSGAREPLRVATLDSVPDDGIARYFPVITDLTDSWNLYRNEPIGAVFLRRERGSSEVQAFNAECPHAGCYVGFDVESNEFHCPCHNSSFQADGKRIDPEHCPSPRDLDALVVDPQKLKQGEVFVEFRKFLTARPQKIAKE